MLTAVAETEARNSMSFWMHCGKAENTSEKARVVDIYTSDDPRKPTCSLKLSWFPTRQKISSNHS